MAVGFDKVRFLAPVFLGDTVTTSYTFEAIDLERDRTLVGETDAWTTLVVDAETEWRGVEDRMIRAANSFASAGLGEAILIGREEQINRTVEQSGSESHPGVTLLNARLSDRNSDYANFLYERMQRRGFLLRDCQRLVNNDRNIFAGAMVAMGDADAMVTGITRNYTVALENVKRVISAKEGHRPIGVSMALCKGRTVFIADTTVHEMPDAEELADIAVEAAGVVRRFGYEPRVAFLSY